MPTRGTRRPRESRPSEVFTCRTRARRVAEPMAAPATLPAVESTKTQPWWRRALPFVLAFGLIGFVLSRIDFTAFLEQLRRVNVVGFAGFTFAIILGLLSADTFATVLVYRRSIAPVSYRDF